MRARHPLLVRALALTLLCVASFAGGRAVAGAAPAAAKLTPQQTVRAYVAAINAKDGRGLCALLHPVEAQAVGATLVAFFADPGVHPKPAPCSRIALSIGSGGGGDNTPRWTRTKIVHMDAAKRHDRGMLSIDVEMRDTWGDGPPSSDTRTTRFYLAPYRGRYVILRRSSTLDQATWSETVDGADAPPATREPRAKDVELPATPACGTATWTATDPEGEGRAAGVPALDLRRISLSDGPTVCVTLQFEAPLLPGSEIDLSLHGSSGPTMYILADGKVYYDLYDETKPSQAGVDYGLVGDRTLVMRFKSESKLPNDAKSLHVITDELSYSEPLIHTQPKILGGDNYGFD